MTIKEFYLKIMNIVYKKRGSLLDETPKFIYSGKYPFSEKLKE